MAAWRPGACPMPAESTLPTNTSPTSSLETRARSSAAPMATAPSRGADRGERLPRNAPIGVRAAPTMKTDSLIREAWALSGAGAITLETPAERRLSVDAARAEFRAQIPSHPLRRVLEVRHEWLPGDLLDGFDVAHHRFDFNVVRNRRNRSVAAEALRDQPAT